MLDKPAAAVATIWKTIRRSSPKILSKKNVKVLGLIVSLVAAIITPSVAGSARGGDRDVSRSTSV